MFERQESVLGAGSARAVKLLALVLLALSAVFAAGQSGSQDEPATKAARGRITYRIYCSNCHGAEGHGDGRLAPLLHVMPTDLTRLTGKDGTFPAERVRQSIDGRADIAAHGLREMPVWGDVFQDPTGTPEGEAASRAKVDDLVEFVRSIQKTGGS
jgi:mono/diheme cytochrome c family protein